MTKDYCPAHDIYYDSDYFMECPECEEAWRKEWEGSEVGKEIIEDN